MAAGVKTTGGQPPIDRGWAWMVCFGFFFYVFFMVGLAKSFGLILGELIKEFGVSTATAALPMSLTLFVYAFGAPTAILIADHFTIQKVVVVGALIGFGGIALSSLLFNVVYFIFTFGLFYGIGNSCFYGNGMIMIGRYFRKWRSLANGLALSGASIGQFAMPPLIEYLLEHYGFSGTLLLIGALYFNGAVAGFLFRPIRQYDPYVEPKILSIDEEKPMVKDSADTQADWKMTNGRGDTSDQNKLLSGANSGNGIGNTIVEGEKVEMDDDWDKERRYGGLIYGSQGSVFMVSQNTLDAIDADKLPMKEEKKRSRNFLTKVLDFSLLRNYVTIFFTVVSFLVFFGYFNFILFLPSIVLEKGIEKYDKAFLISICGIGDLIARVSVGFFADLNIIPRYRIKALACLLCGINVFMFVFADSYPWLAVHCFLYGYLGGGYVCMIGVVLVDLLGLANMGPNLAVVLFIQGIGASAGNPFLGYLKDQTGSFHIVIIFCAITLVCGAIILFFYPLVKRLEEQRTARIQS